MARSFDGVDDSITTGLSAHATTRSYALWVMRSGAHEGGLGRVMDKRASGGAEVELIYEDDTGGNQALYYNRTWSTTQGQWTIPRPTSGVWYSLVVTYDAGSTANDPLIYLNGASQTVTEAVAPVGTLSTNSDAYMLGNRSAGDRTWNGRLAEFAVWDVILTADEAAALGDGFSPLLIRPASLVSYVPLLGRQSPEPDWKIAGGASVTGAAAADHPRIFRPRARQLYSPRGVTTFNQTVAATVNVTATATKSVGKIVSASTTVTASMVRSVGKTLSASVTATGSVVKSVGKIVTANTTVTATVASAITRVQTLTANVTAAASMTRSVGKIVSANVSAAASVVKDVGKTLTANTTVAATLSAPKTVLQSLSANVTVAASLATQFVAGTTAKVLRTLLGLGR